MKQKKTTVAIIVILLVLLIDQLAKVWIKTNMTIGDEYVIFDWFRIYFIENDGMAFGWALPGNWGKLILSTFRIVAVGFIVFILKSLIENPKVSTVLVASIALIFAGAVGNIIDSVFYGTLFSSSDNGQIAQFLPEAGGYAPLMFGKVVDMLYFPLYEGYLPNWVPIWGGDYFAFFRPVFNIADTAITLGVFSIIIFQRSFFLFLNSEEEKEKSETQNAANNVTDTDAEDINNADASIA